MKNESLQFRSIKVNALLNVTKQLCKIIFPLITIPYVTRVLQSDGYGAYNFGSSIISYFILLAGLGISDYAIREGSRVRESKEKFQVFAEEIFSINCVSTFISYVLLLLLLVFSKQLLDYRLLIIVQSIPIVLNTLGCDWVNSVYEDYLYITVRYLIMQLISIILMFIFVKDANSYIIYAAVTTIALSGGNIFNLVYIKRYFNIKFNFSANLKYHIKPIMILFFNTVAATIYVNSDITMLGYLQNEVAVGIYSLSTKIYLVVKQLLNALVMVALPRLSSYIGSDNNEKYEVLSRKIFSSICTLVLPCVIGMYVLSEEIIQIIGGSEYISGILSLRLLSIALFFSVLSVFYCCAILLPFKKEKICLVASSISAFINVALNFIFIPTISYNGAALTTLISEMFIFIVYSIYIRKITNLKWDYKQFLSIIIGCIGIAIICFGIKMFISDLLIKILLSVFLSGFFYFAVQIILRNRIVIDFFHEVMEKVKKNVSASKEGV